MANPAFSLTMDTKSLKKAFLSIQKNGLKSLSRSLFKEGEGVMAQAKQITPLKTGALRSSGHVMLPKISKTKVTVVLGFGGPAAPYALTVHEDLNAFHPIGQAKYLESPLKQAAPNMMRRIAKDLAADLKRSARPGRKR